MKQWDDEVTTSKKADGNEDADMKVSWKGLEMKILVTEDEKDALDTQFVCSCSFLSTFSVTTFVSS